PPLSVLEVDAGLTRVAALSGRGSAGERARLLRELLGRASEPEREFLAPLLVGELRPGALEAIMVEARALSASFAPAEVRRSLILAGTVGAVASAAIAQGSAGVA